MIKLFKSLKPFRLYLIFVLILLSIQSLSNLYLPKLMADIINDGIITNNTNYILNIGVIMILVSFISVVATILAAFFSAKISNKFGGNLRIRVFSKVENLAKEDFEKFGTASLITRSINDINQVQQVVSTFMHIMIIAPITCIGGTIMAFYTNHQLALMLILLIPIFILVIGLVGTKSIFLFKIIQLKLDKINLILRENLMGIKIIRAFNRVDFEKERFNSTNIDLTKNLIKANKILAFLNPAMFLILDLSTVAILWLGGIKINNGTMNVGNLLAFIQYVGEIMASILMVSKIFSVYPRALASSERINEILDVEPKIKDIYISNKESSKKGYIEFKNVTFKYPGAKEPVLKKISFTSKPGELTAIIGNTGCGKSTLVNLIPRLYDLTEGSILIDDIDIKDFSLKDLRKKIGFAPQNSVLFSGTIKDNIKYGNKNATNKEIKESAKISQATEFISTMKDGFDSFISQCGNNLSCGQKQRISIARALVRKAEIYIFDDTFSAMDYKTSINLFEELKKTLKDSTVIFISQRINSIINADKIIVLNDGVIVGMGTHWELLNSCKIYKEIVLSQFPKGDF